MAGATGFTGRRVAALLLSDRHELRCLVRRTSDVSVLPEGTRHVVGDLGDDGSLDEWLIGCEAMVYCASMGFGHVPSVVAAAERARIGRAVFVSTTALFTRLPARSKIVRTVAEDAVRGSTLDWTLVRPTMIYGAPGDRNMERLLHRLARWPALPVPGDGGALIQPVHVDDLARGIVAAVDAHVASRMEYDFSGADALPLRDAIATAAGVLGRPGRTVHLPLRPVCWILGFVEALGVRLPIRREQVLRLAEDKAFSHEKAARDLGFMPRTFAQGIAEEAAALGLVEGMR